MDDIDMKEKYQGIMRNDIEQKATKLTGFIERWRNEIHPMSSHFKIIKKVNKKRVNKLGASRKLLKAVKFESLMDSETGPGSWPTEFNYTEMKIKTIKRVYECIHIIFENRWKL